MWHDLYINAPELFDLFGGKIQRRLVLRPPGIAHDAVKGSFFLHDFVNCILDALLTRDIGGDGDDSSGVASLSILKVFSNVTDVDRIDFRRAITKTAVRNT
jgi:hypothetical protein